MGRSVKERPGTVIGKKIRHLQHKAQKMQGRLEVNLTKQSLIVARFNQPN